MANYFENPEKKKKRQRDLNRYYNEKSNLRLKYAALVSIAISIILLLAMTLMLDHISATMLLFMRGCAGLSAIVFVALYAILVYRVNNSYFKDKADSRQYRH